MDQNMIDLLMNSWQQLLNGRLILNTFMTISKVTTHVQRKITLIVLQQFEQKLD